MKTKLKILFLSMTCREPLFAEQVNTVKETWGKDIIEKKYGDNVDLMFYDGWDNAHSYNAKTKILHVRCEDDGDNTFKKTYYALKIIQSSKDYDYIFRTNTSTYVNVPLAIKLIEYIEESDKKDVLWTSEMLSLVEACVPFPLNIYGRGNGLIMSREIIDILLKDGVSHLYDEKCDDVLIGNVLNSHWIREGENYLDHIKSMGHAWFRCVEKFGGTNNHQLCEYYNNNSDFEFLKKFITIQIKQYYHRSDEHENYLLLHESFKDKEDKEIEKSLKGIIEYSKHPDVFIGSILGYVRYDWYKDYNKQKMWDIQCKNKADNDPHKEIFKNKIWY